MSDEAKEEELYTRHYLILYEHGVLVGYVFGDWLHLEIYMFHVEHA
jgi:hypothetical protein